MGILLPFLRPSGRDRKPPVPLNLRERVQVCVQIAAILAILALVPRMVAKASAAPEVSGVAPNIHANLLANGPTGVGGAGGAGGVPGATGANTVDLASFRGQIVVLDFWATWCGPCNITSPILDGFAKAHAGEGVKVLGISTDNDEDDVRTWLTRHRVSYVIAHDGDGTAGRAFGVSNLPTLVIIDRLGNIRARRVGVTQRAELERLLAAVR